jgi:signal transduction histidine kinase
MRGGGAAVLVTTAVSAVVTFAIALVPQVHFAYWHPLLHVALETAASLIALLASVLVAGRLRRRSQLNELLLGCALVVLTLLNLFFLTVTAVVRQAPPELVVGTALAGSSLGAVFFALAAFAPARRLRRPGLALAAGTAGVAVVLVAVAVAAGLPHQPGALLVVSASPPADLQAQSAVLVLELFMTLLYGGAAAGFLLRSRQLGDEFSGWLAIAAILAAASHLNYFLYPALYSAWVHIGDVFRLCFYAVLLAGSMREIWSYWQGLSEAAVLSERQRIARDLHDGLAQELAYLARNLDAPGLEPGSDAQRRLRRAVERAQFESRRAVSTLTAPAGQAVEIVLADAVGEIADRFHVGLDLDLGTGVRLPAERAEALVRIACEAVTNAARHSGSSRVCLNVERDGTRVRLRISDQGRGFDTAVPGGGFGLISMCERAQSVGGEVRISSAPGRGSQVEVAL